MSFSVTLTEVRTNSAPYMTIIMNLIYCHIDKFSIANLRVIKVIFVLLPQAKVIIADFLPSS